MSLRRTAFRSMAATACFAASCCVPAPDAPPAVVTPAPTPAPSPTGIAPPPVVVQPTYDNWLDAPATPGDWSYRADSTGTLALFGQASSEPRFAVRCAPSTRTVSLLRAGTGNGDVVMRIRTETGDRMLTARQVGDQLPSLRVDLPASDPILAAIAFSKGRFAVETQGLPTLYVPAYPEITRAIEDCL